MIEYTLQGILSNWRQWNWDEINYPLRKQEVDVILSAIGELTHCRNCRNWKRNYGTNEGYCDHWKKDIDAEGYCCFSEE